MSMQSPLTSFCRSFFTNTITFKSRPARLFVLLGLIGVAATGLAATASSSASLRQIIFGGASSLVRTRGAQPKAAMTDRLLADVPAPDGSNMSVERRGHTATLLSDGRVLIAGGENSSGVLGQAEIYDPAAASFSAAGNLNTARVDHSATLLSDGRVLFAGGRDSAGAINTTEIFDPVTGVFTSGPNMSVARAGHSATLFADGRILIAGGDGSGSAEILDLSAGSSATVGANMNDARSMHSAALLQDGRVLIVGGRDAGGNELSSGEIFDPASSSFTGVGGMEVARVHPLLRVLFDGKVQIIGGNDDRSMEIYDPAAGIFGGYAQVPPDGDLHADLINEVMSAPTRAALLTGGQTITELGSSALATGGIDANGNATSAATIYASSGASVSSDKVDYLPGTQVIITGRGFQPNENITLTFHEYPHVDTAELHTFTVQADADGNFTFDGYAPEDADLGITYILGAKGESSGRTAQTTFTDNRTITNVTLNGGASVSVAPGASITANVFVTTALGNVNWRSTAWRIDTTVPGSTTCVNTPNHDGAGSYSESFSITAPTTAGTYNAYFIAYQDDVCGAGASNTFTLTNPPNGVTVNPGPLSAFAVTNTSDGPIGTQTAGTPFNVKVRAVDANGNTVTSFDGGGNKVMLDSVPAGNLSAPTGASAAFTLGVLSPVSVTFSTAGGPYPGTFSIKATRNTGGTENGTSNSFTVNAPACTNPAVTTQPTNQTVTYGAASASFTAAASGTPAPTVQWQVQVGGVGPFTNLSNAASYSGVTSGTLVITNPTVSLSGNKYQAVFTNTCGGTQTATSNVATLTVNKATVTPTITVNNKTYDGTTSATIATRSLTGIVGSDDVNLGSSGTAAFVDKNVGNGKTVNITGLALSGTTAGNYQLSSTSATTTANITTKAITTILTAADKTYDGANAEPNGSMSCSLSGVLAGDSANVLCTGELHSGCRGYDDGLDQRERHCAHHGQDRNGIDHRQSDEEL